MQKEQTLSDLLMELFPSSTHLKRFLQFSPNTAPLVPRIPTLEPMRLFVLMTIDELRRHGLIDTEFFERLSSVDPEKTIHINEVKKDWLSDLNKWGKFPASEEKLKPHTQTPSVFISYSRRDELFFQELLTHLQILSRKGKISIWTEGRIGAGEEWSKSIQSGIENAHLIILLISADFLSSDFVWGDELKQAFERSNNGSAIIIPILLKDCFWQDSPIASLQMLPANGKPLSLSPNVDRAWVEIANTISTLASKWREKA